MLGRATLTIETSRRVMKPAARTTASAFQRSGSGRYSPLRGRAGRTAAADATDRGSLTSSVVVVMTVSSQEHDPLRVPDRGVGRHRRRRLRPTLFCAW